MYPETAVKTNIIMMDIITTDKAHHSAHNYKINICGYSYLNRKSLYTIDITRLWISWDK